MAASLVEESFKLISQKREIQIIEVLLQDHEATVVDSETLDMEGSEVDFAHVMLAPQEEETVVPQEEEIAEPLQEEEIAELLQEEETVDLLQEKTATAQSGKNVNRALLERAQQEIQKEEKEIHLKGVRKNLLWD